MLYILFICGTLYWIGLQGTRPILSLYTHSITDSELMVGLLVATYALFPMLLAVVMGQWLDRLGAYKVVSLGGLGMFVAYLIPFLYPTIPMLFVSQTLAGLSQIGVLMAFQKTFGNMPGNRDKLIIWFALTGSIGEMLGPLLSGFSYENFGFQISYGYAALFVFIPLIIGLLMPQAWKSGSKNQNPKKTNLLSSYKTLRHVPLRKAVIAGALVLFSKDLFIAYFPVYGASVGLDPGMIGLIIATMAMTAILIRLMQVWLVETFSRSKVLMITLILSGVAYLLIPINTQIIVLFILAALLGIGLGLGQPLSLVYVLNISATEKHGEILGLRMTFNRGAQFFAPIFFGLLGSAWGVIMIFMMCGSVLLIGSWATKLPLEDSRQEDRPYTKTDKKTL